MVRRLGGGLARSRNMLVWSLLSGRWQHSGRGGKRGKATTADAPRQSRCTSTISDQAAGGRRLRTRESALCKLEVDALCAICPVRQPCLAYAVADAEISGIWGGTSERERRKLRVVGPLGVSPIGVLQHTDPSKSPGQMHQNVVVIGPFRFSAPTGSCGILPCSCHVNGPLGVSSSRPVFRLRDTCYSVPGKRRARRRSAASAARRALLRIATARMWRS